MTESSNTSCPFHTKVTAWVAGPSCLPFSTMAIRSHVAQAIAGLHSEFHQYNLSIFISNQLLPKDVYHSSVLYFFLFFPFTKAVCFANAYVEICSIDREIQKHKFLCASFRFPSYNLSLFTI